MKKQNVDRKWSKYSVASGSTSKMYLKSTHIWHFILYNWVDTLKGLFNIIINQGEFNEFGQIKKIFKVLWIVRNIGKKFGLESFYKSSGSWNLWIKIIEVKDTH